MPRHHLVPQMYLKNFATADEKLVMVRRENLAFARPTSVVAACREAGFYTIPTEDLEPDAREGHDPEAVEKVLASIEGKTAPLISAILTTDTVPQLENFDRYRVAQFAALQATRTWAFRRDFVELARIGRRTGWRPLRRTTRSGGSSKRMGTQRAQTTSRSSAHVFWVRTARNSISRTPSARRSRCSSL